MSGCRRRPSRPLVVWTSPRPSRRPGFDCGSASLSGRLSGSDLHQRTPPPCARSVFGGWGARNHPQVRVPRRIAGRRQAGRLRCRGHDHCTGWLGRGATAQGRHAGAHPRQLEVLRARARGLSYKAIGSAMFLSPKTVEEYMAEVNRKFADYLRDHSPADLERLLGVGQGDLASTD